MIISKYISLIYLTCWRNASDALVRNRRKKERKKETIDKTALFPSVFFSSANDTFKSTQKEKFQNR